MSQLAPLVAEMGQLIEVIMGKGYKRRKENEPLVRERLGRLKKSPRCKDCDSVQCKKVGGTVECKK